MSAFITHPNSTRKHLGRGLMVWSVLFGCTPSSEITTRSQFLMGTTVQITVVSNEERAADAAITEAFREIKRIEALLSSYIETSEVSKINQSAGIKPVKVSPEVLLVVKKALEISKLTEGGFNIALGPAIDLWDLTGDPKIPTVDEIDSVRPLIDISGIRVDDIRHTVYLQKPGMRINVGGIGKGYAADRAQAILKNHGITNGIVAVAGDLKTFGRKPDGKPWRIAIRHPRKQDSPLAEITLRDEAVSTSGDYERFYIEDGRRYHHILDPRTLYPSNLAQSVTVVSREGMRADALATGLFVMGPQKALALVEQLPDVESVIVDAKGKLWISSGLEQRLNILN